MADLVIPEASENKIAEEAAPWLMVRRMTKATQGSGDSDGEAVPQHRDINVIPSLTLRPACSLGRHGDGVYERLQPIHT